MGLINIVAIHINAADGQPLVDGTLGILATDQYDVPIPFSMAGGGQNLPEQGEWPIVNGVIIGLALPDPATTNPRGVNYRFTVTDNSTMQRLPPYACVNISGGPFWNFDTYNPSANVPQIPNNLTGGGLGSVVVSGSPQAGQVVTATSSTTAVWQDPLADGTLTPVTITGVQNGINTSFTLTVPAGSAQPVSAAFLLLGVNGLPQTPGFDFTVLGDDLTITPAPLASDVLTAAIFTGPVVSHPLTATSNPAVWLLPSIPPSGVQPELNGLYQSSPSDYSLAGLAVTFTVPPSSLDVPAAIY